MRRYVVGLLLLALAVPIILAVIRNVDAWAFSAGMFSGALVCLALWLWDEPPEFIAKWGRGAEGEEKTAKALKPLVRQGWRIRHDVPIRRGNADHVLLSPSGSAFVLETKTLVGKISVEHGTLTCRFSDDPSEVRRYDVKTQTDRLIAEIGSEWAKRTGRPAPPLSPIVVLWGSFPDRVIIHDDITFVAGDHLVEVLAATSPWRRRRWSSRLRRRPS